MILRSLKPCNPSSSVGRSDPQCVSPQQKAAKQPLDEPQEPTRLLQELITKPQRQSVVPKRSQASQPKQLGKHATWHSTEGRSPHFNMQQTSKAGMSKGKSGDKKQPSSKEINHWLVDLSSAEQVLRIYAQHRERFNIINISTAFHRIAKHSKRMSPAERRRLQADSDAKKLALAALDHMEDNKPYSLSNLAWSQATLPLGPPQFLPKVLQVVEHMMLDCQSEELKDHQLSIICWAAVKEKCLTRSFWDLISPTFCQMLPDTALQVLCNMTWVCATAGFHDDTAFIQAAAAAVTNCAGSLRGQVAVPAAPSMHMPLHPFAHEFDLNVPAGSVSLFKSPLPPTMLCCHASSRARSCPQLSCLVPPERTTSQPLVLSNLAWSFAKLGYFEQRLWDALAATTIATAGQLRSVELAQLTWAFGQAIADQAANDGIDSLRAEVQLASFEKSFISQHNRDLLLQALRDQSLKLISEGRMSLLLCEDAETLQALSTCASAFTSIGYYNQALLTRTADLIARDPVGIGLQVPVNFTWVCSSQRFYHPKFLQGFAQQGLKLLQNPSTAALFNDMHIATTLHGFASHTVEADDAVCWAFIRALADRAVAMLEDFRPQALANSAWGLAVLGHLHPAFFLKLRRLTLGSLHNIISEELHQLYQVELILRLEAPQLGLDTSHIQDSDALFAALQERGHFVGVAQTSWRNCIIFSSDLQQRVALVLESLNLPCELEPECTQTEYTIDIALPDIKLAIEVDGPLHFMRNVPKPTGRTAVKRRCLQQLGWTVLSVPFFHWNSLDDKPLLRQAYMLERLRQARVWPEASPPTESVGGILPGMVVGPMPMLVSPDTADLQTVKELVEESEKLGLLCHPRSNDAVVEGADSVNVGGCDQTASKVQKAQGWARLTADERKQLLLHKAGKHTKSRYELLLHVALNRRKVAT